VAATQAGHLTGCLGFRAKCRVGMPCARTPRRALCWFL